MLYLLQELINKTIEGLKGGDELKVESRTRFIAIKNEALLRKDLKPVDKYILMILENRKLFDTKDGNWYTIEIRTKKLKTLCEVTDNRTLLASLNRLRKFNYINYSFEKDDITNKEILHNTNKISIKINCSPPFTLVDEEMFQMLKNLKTGKILLDNKPNRYDKPHRVTILYYILEYYHNPDHGGDQGVASPSRKVISDSLSIHNTKLTELIKVMHDSLICEYRQGFFYDGFRRTTNRYLPNTIRHKKGEEFIGQNRRRYKTHKRDTYFYTIIKED